MKFNEFRELVEKRRNLIEQKLNATNALDRDEFEIQIDENDERIFGSYEFASSKLFKIFYIGAENVKNFLIKYFKDKEDNVEVNFSGFLLNLEVVTDKKYYFLGSYENNQSLQCLYSKTNFDWENLLEDYPDLLNFLWREYYEFKNVEKRREMSLIQRKLDEKNKELDFLMNPEKVYERITELRAKRKQYQTQIAEIQDIMETVNFD